MACSERWRLFREYEDAVFNWSHLTEYKYIKNLMALAAALRKKGVAAKKAYDDHRAVHGC